MIRHTIVVFWYAVVECYAHVDAEFFGSLQYECLSICASTHMRTENVIQDVLEGMGAHGPFTMIVGTFSTCRVHELHTYCRKLNYQPGR